jgi:hypothetical protein
MAETCHSTEIRSFEMELEVEPQADNVARRERQRLRQIELRNMMFTAYRPGVEEERADRGTADPNH